MPIVFMHDIKDSRVNLHSYDTAYCVYDIWKVNEMVFKDLNSYDIFIFPLSDRCIELGNDH